jgi:hypothetical protein
MSTSADPILFERTSAATCARTPGTGQVLVCADSAIHQRQQSVSWPNVSLGVIVRLAMHAHPRFGDKLEVLLMHKQLGVVGLRYCVELSGGRSHSGNSRAGWLC